MKTSESIKTIAPALHKAQSEVVGAAVDATNPHFKSRYSSLESVWDAIKGPLSKNGLFLSQGATQLADGDWALITRILHISGEWIETSHPLVSAKEHDPQAMGSAVSYGKRYSMKAIFAVCDAGEDDDGEGAMARKPIIPNVAKTPEQVQAQVKAKTGIATPVERLMNAQAKSKTVGPPLGPHEHLWTKSQYGENKEYCRVCKQVRSTDDIPY